MNAVVAGSHSFDRDRLPPRRRTGLLRDWMLAAFLWIYALLVAAWCLFGRGGAPALQEAVTWQPLPSQLVTLLLLWPLLREMEPGARRAGWRLIGLAAVSDVIATLWWSAGTGMRLFTQVNWSLLPYLLYYPLMSAAFVMFFRALGGTFRSAQARLDLATLVCGVGATIWLFQMRPLLAETGWSNANAVSTVIFCAGDGLTLVLMSMMAMRIVEWRPELPLLLLGLAAFTSFITDLIWADQDRQLFQSDAWSNAGGFGLYYALLGTALLLERHYRVPATVRILESNRLGILPVLSVLVAVGMLCGPGVDLRRAHGLVLLLFAFIATLLVVARQYGMRREIDTLQQALTRRAAQTQLTELMRQSADLVAVATAELRLSFVSPSSERLLGVGAAQLAQRDATQILGDEHESRMREFLAQLMLGPDARAELELPVSAADGTRKTVQAFGSNQLHNTLIAGIVLTFRDVTERRRLEQELVEIAVLERARLAQDIRDSLGSELERIGQMIAGLRRRGLRGEPVGRSDIAEVVAQVNLSIDTARRLSMSLSPLNVARGALDVALDTLCADFSRRFGMSIEADVRLGARTVAGREADHVLRIVEKIVGCAARHGARSLQLTVRTAQAQLELAVAGSGLAPGSEAAPGGMHQVMDLRLAQYQAHVLGGTLRRECGNEGWRVEVGIPLPA